MALNLPSWLDLPNFVAAMRSGAEAGLQARQQDREEASAADRLQYAYSALHEKERTAALQIKARQQQAADALAMRNTIVRSQLDDRAEARQQQAQHWSDVLNKPTIHVGTRGEVLKVTPSGAVDVLRPAQEPPIPPGTETMDPEGNVLSVHGQPGSKVIEGVLQKRKAKDDQAAADALKPSAIGDFFRGLAHPFVDHPDWRHPFTDPNKTERVKVVGPDGKKGTVPKGTALPEGWKLDQ